MGSHPIVAQRPDDLPNFENPPLAETVLSVQFEALRGFGTAHLGLLWNEFSHAFPQTEDQAALAPIIEEFSEGPRPRLGLQLRAFERPPVPRMWFVSARGNEMIQVQADRFIKNWRKEGQGEEYPRYEKVKASFERDFSVFERFLKQKGLDQPRINQCELSYVNHIIAGQGWGSFRDYRKVFIGWAEPSGEVPGHAEDVRLQTRFIIPENGGKPVGRLHVDIQPAFRASDNQPMYLFHLTARGQLGNGVEFFDLGRRWIVKSFAALTTPEMHRVWNRTDSHGNI